MSVWLYNSPLRPLPHTDAVLALVLNIQREHKVLMKDISTDIATVPAAYKQ